MSASRPPVDLVMPLAGDDHTLARAVARLATLTLGQDDTVTIVNNGAQPLDDAPLAQLPVRATLVHAPEIASSYYARNVGARQSSNPWLVFLDDDAEPVPDLVDRYFDPEPAPETGLIAGGIVPGPPEPGGGLAVRVSYVRRTLAHEQALRPGWEYAQTANAAVRRAAFDDVGGFTVVNSGGDADFAFRLRRAGWGFEVRSDASITHHNRATFRGLMRQRMRHGTGAGWLETNYPGFGPPESWGRVAIRFPRKAAVAGVRLAQGNTDAALVAATDPFIKLAIRVGYLRSNEAPSREVPRPSGAGS